MTYESPGSTVKNLGVTARGVTYNNVTGIADSPGSLKCLKTRPCEDFTMSDVPTPPHITV